MPVNIINYNCNTCGNFYTVMKRWGKGHPYMCTQSTFAVYSGHIPSNTHNLGCLCNSSGFLSVLFKQWRIGSYNNYIRVLPS